MGWMAPAPIGVAMRHNAGVINCSGEEPPNARYNNRPGFGQERFSGARSERIRRDSNPPSVAAQSGAKLFQETAVLSGWHGGLRDISSLGARAHRIGSRSAIDASPLCEALCKTEQE